MKHQGSAPQSTLAGLRPRRCGGPRIDSRSSRRTPCAPFFRTGCGGSAVEEIQRRRQIYLEEIGGSGLSRKSSTRWISGLLKKGKIVSSVSGLVSMKSTVSVSGFWMVGHGPDRMTTWPNRNGC